VSTQDLEVQLVGVILRGHLEGEQGAAGTGEHVFALGLHNTLPIILFVDENVSCFCK